MTMPAKSAVTTTRSPAKIRRLCVILGDQLNRDSALFDDFDSAQDLLWMAEVQEESTHVPSNKQRSVMFIAAMRHFAQSLRDEKIPLYYSSLDDVCYRDFPTALAATLVQYQPAQVRVVLPGDYRVLQTFKGFCAEHNLPLELLADNHFVANTFQTKS